MSGWVWLGVGAVVWVLVVVFVLLGAGWNRAGDEAAQRMADRRRDNENPEDQT